MNSCLVTFLKLLSLLSVLSFLFIGCSNSKLRPNNLRCEYLKNPIGIDVVNPRLSWELAKTGHAENNIEQTAYQIQISSDKEYLLEGKADIWDSGFVSSDQSIQISCKGMNFRSGTKYFWRVRIKDQEGKLSGWSTMAYWETGLLQSEAWQAKWIGDTPQEIPADLYQSPKIPPSPLFRKVVDIKKNIQEAKVYISSLGYYELSLNGDKVGNQVLAPEWTDFKSKVQYQTYDISSALRIGKNVFGVMLADGWYAGRIGPVKWRQDYPRRGAYGSLDRKFITQLEINYSDGSKEMIISNDTWKRNPDGFIRSADNFLGECIDFRKYDPNWNNIEYDDSNWKNAVIYDNISVLLKAQMNEPIKKLLEIAPKSITEPVKGSYIFDMGQNMVGWVRLTLREPQGQKIVVRHGEMLDEKGRLYTENLDSASQTDTIICDGKEHIYEPRFTYHGFRFVEVTGFTEKPSLNKLKGIHIASASPLVGKFHCSDSMLNQLWNNILWTQRNNMISVPTDCPQRDERMGWMGDAQVFAQTAIYNLDMAAFFSKWVADIRDAQDSDGRYPDFAPHPHNIPEMPFMNAPGWADAGVIVPWRLYQNYDDMRVIEDHYASVKKFVDFLWSKNENLIWKNEIGHMYGDWLNGNTIVSDNYPNTGGKVPDDVFATAFFYNSAITLAKMAGLLEKHAQQKKYSNLAEDIKQAFSKEFVDESGHIKGNTQAGYAMALSFSLLSPELEKKAVEYMVEGIHAYDDRISTGFISTILMMQELSKRGYNDLAYKLAQSKRFPSWGYTIEQGATTIWERWDGFVKGRGFQNPGMNSFDHYAIGAIGEWLYSTMLGINFDENIPGFKHIILSPKPGGTVSFAEGSYHSISGIITSKWEKKGQEIHYYFSVPQNTWATIKLVKNQGSTIVNANKNDVEFIESEEYGVNYWIAKTGSGYYHIIVNLSA